MNYRTGYKQNFCVCVILVWKTSPQIYFIKIYIYIFQQSYLKTARNKRASFNLLLPTLMKKALLLSVLAIGAMSANAQAVEQPGFCQNWSIGIDGGVTTPLHHPAFFGSMRGVFGLNVKKQITPTFGLGVEGYAGVNTSSWKGWPHSSTAIDNSYVGVFGSVDLFNLFGGYNCEVRPFTIEAVAGAGWGHDYIHNNTGAGIPDENYFATKVGLNFNINCNEHLTVAIKPSVGWNMNGGRAEQSPTYYNVDNAVFNIEAGLVYHIGGNGFECVRPYDYAEVEALNAQVNDMRAALQASMINSAAWEAKAASLAEELATCMSRQPEVKVIKETEVTNTLSSVRYVFFKIGSSVITPDQMPNVEMIAAYLKNHPDATVVVKGYASQDGPLDINIKLANNRAEAVRKALIDKYGIKANRIQAEGEGIGNMFKEESWNRVSICTIEDNN